MKEVSKWYRLGAGRYSLVDALAAMPRRIVRPRKSATQGMWALRDLSLGIGTGQVMGVIGQNGAGKTTLLRLLSRVTKPTSGSVTVRGRVSALIELGAGFHPDLTGRENVFLNGAILGLGRGEMKRRFDEIVAFSELERFIDTPVKRYSSGMYARLGFAVAANVSPEVLLVDEVLAVGDSSFQNKCYRRIRDIVEAGRTVVVVSHNLSVLQGLCHSIVWLDHGELRLQGDPAEVIAAYLAAQEQGYTGDATPRLELDQAGPLSIRRIVLRNGRGEETTEFESGDSLTVEMHYSARTVVRGPYFSVAVSDAGSGLLFQGTMLLNDEARTDLYGDGIASCRFEGIPLLPKAYQLWGSVRDDIAVAALVRWQPLAAFRVVAPPAALGDGSRCKSISHLMNDAPIYVPHTWSLLQGADGGPSYESSPAGDSRGNGR